MHFPFQILCINSNRKSGTLEEKRISINRDGASIKLHRNNFEPDILFSVPNNFVNKTGFGFFVDQLTIFSLKITITCSIKKITEQSSAENLYISTSKFFSREYNTPSSDLTFPKIPVFVFIHSPSHRFHLGLDFLFFSS